MERLAVAGERALVGRAREGGDEAADEDHLRRRHADVGRHLEGAQLDEALPARGALGGEELVDADLGAVRVAGDVDEEVAEEHVREPRRRRRRVLCVRRRGARAISSS